MSIWDFFGRRTERAMVQDTVRAEIAPLIMQLDETLERLAALGNGAPLVAAPLAAAPLGTTGIIGSTDFLSPQPLVAAPNYAQAYAMNEPRRWRDWSDPRIRPYRAVTTDTLRSLAQTYDVLASCIAHLKDQVLKTPLRFAPREDGDGSEETGAQVSAARRFFDTAGGLGGPDASRLEFEGRWLDDLLVLGACALWFDYQTLGARLDGIPDSVLAIDAATIRPLITAWGFAPGADEPVYEQVVQGVRVAAFRRDEMVYEGLPIFAQTSSPYFLSPIELLVLVVMTALKSDEWNRTWLTDGNVPDRLIQVPKEWTPTQIKEYSDYFDALLSGNSRERHRAKMVPQGVTASGESRKEADFQAFDAWLRDRVCALMGVAPASVGHASDTYQYAQDGARKNTRDNRVAQLLLFRNTLYTDICRRKGWDAVQVTDQETDAENARSRAERHQLLISSGQRTVNECRHADGLDPSPEPSADVLLITGSLVPLSKLTEGEQESDGGKDGGGKPAANDGNDGKAQTATLDTGQDDRAPNTQAGAAQAVAALASAHDREEAEINLAADPDAVKAELSRWERKCLNRLARGERASCGFNSEVLPDEVCALVRAELERYDRDHKGGEHKHREHVRRAFATVRAHAPALARGLSSVLKRSATWDESKHPRDEQGRWTNGLGATAPQARQEPLTQEEWDTSAAFGQRYPDPANMSPLCQQVREIHEAAEFEIAVQQIKYDYTFDAVAQCNADIFDLYFTPENDRSSTHEAQLKQLDAKREKLVEERDAARKAIVDLRLKSREEMHRAILGADFTALQLNYNLTREATPEEHKRLQEGFALFNQLLWRAPIVPQDIKVKPPSAARRARVKTQPTRGQFDADTSTIVLGTQYREDTIVHELGHWLEENYPIILQAAIEHHAARTANEEPQLMSKATKNSKYGDDEYTKPDGFYSAYMGKWYTDKAGNIIGTELISGALGVLATEPGDLAEKDALTFDFICSLIGALPRHPNA